MMVLGVINREKKNSVSAFGGIDADSYDSMQ